jgi:carboxyl-terminal processing protease
VNFHSVLFGGVTMLHKLRAPLIFVAGLLLGIGTTFGYSVWAARAAPGLPWQQASLFADVYEQIRRDYIEDIPAERLMSNAVHGLTSGLDQYSTYLDAREYDEMRLNTAGAYSGVGIEISLETGQLKVVAAVDDSPASRAGIRGGDLVVSIDDVAVDSEHLDDAVDRLRGKPGAHVKLSIRRADNPQLLEFDLIRRKVQMHSVKADLLEPGYGYVRVSQFTETTADDFLAAVNGLQAREPMRGLVLDLRNNPGGVLEAGVAVADVFLDSGVIVTAQGRAVGADFAMQAHPGDALNGAPIIVLVNGGSASASEIVAGALKDHARAKLVGQTTYGKGTVQSVVPLAQGGALKLTTSRYHTPSGATIQQRGITPDIVITNLAHASPATSGQAKLLLDDLELRAALDTLKAQPANSAPQRH